MTNWIRLDASEHGASGFSLANHYRWAAGTQDCPVLMRELREVLAGYPLLFAPRPVAGDGDGQSGAFDLVALLSFERGRNLYLGDKGQWLAAYVPSHFRAWPFTLMRAEGGDDGAAPAVAIGIDADSGRLQHPVAAAGDQRFFDSNGDWTPYMQKVARFLVERVKGTAHTRELVDKLASHGVIKSTPLQWRADAAAADTAGQRDVRVCKGYAVIDEKALGNLPAEAYHELGRCGALALAFAQVFSLARLRELQGRETAWQRQHQSLSDADLARLMGDDDTLKFDF